MNVIAADTEAAAAEQLQARRRGMATALVGRGRTFSDTEAEAFLAAGAGAHVDSMMTYTGAGTPSQVRQYLEAFRDHTGADELIVAHGSPTTGARLRSVALTAEAMDSVAA